MIASIREESSQGDYTLHLNFGLAKMHHDWQNKQAWANGGDGVDFPKRTDVPMSLKR